MSFIKKHKVEIFIFTFFVALVGFAAGTAYGTYYPANNGAARTSFEKKMEGRIGDDDGDGRQLPDGCMPNRGGRRHMHGGGMDRPDGMMPGQSPDENAGPGAGQTPDDSTQPGADQAPDTNTDPKNEKPDDSTDSKEDNDNNTEKNPDTTSQPKNNTTNNII